MNSPYFIRIHHFYCLLLAVFFVSLYSKTTSPLYDCWYVLDSSVYQLMGKWWSEGYLPYVDMWELKGPAMFLIEAIGWGLTSSKFGIYIVQILFMFITYLLIYRMYTIEYQKKMALFLLCLTILLMDINYQGGNTIEEFTLPFLVVSFSYLYKWTKEPQKDGIAFHNPKVAIIYGLLFGYCLMTRLTDAIGVCGGLLVVIVYLIYHHSWKNLFHNIYAFLLGVLLVVVPFCIYFYVNDALYEMWYGTFIFNLSYANSSALVLTDLLSVKLFVVGFLNVFVLLLVSLNLLIFHKERWLGGWMWLVVGSLTLLWIVNSNGYGHYGMIALPYVVICLNEKRVEFNRKFSLGKVLLLGYICFALKFGLPATQDFKTRYQSYDIFVELWGGIPENDRDKFCAYNISSSFYLINNVKPCYRYIGVQDWLMRISDEFKNRAYSEFSSCKAKWLLVDFMGREKVGISDILSSHYEVKLRKDNYILYELVR